jgi:hypothetical protein
MPVLQTQNPTLADVAKRTDPSGKISAVVELLSQNNEILDDMVWTEGNLPTGHKTTIRSGLPTPTWRKLYGGVQPAKSTTVQITESCGNLEAYAEVDKDLADLNGNTNDFRLSEDKAFIEGMSQEMAATLFYGNDAIENAKFTGLAPRYNSLTAESGQNILDAGGTGSDNTSIWLVGWSADTIAGIYPKAKKAGLQSEDKGVVTIENVDGAGGRMEAYRMHYKWECGLVVRDWRYAVRIANIDVSDLQTGADPVAYRKKIIDLMVRATEQLQSTDNCKPVFYMHRSVRTAIRQGILDKSAGNLSEEKVAGKLLVQFDGIPCRRVDRLLLTEARVV